MSFAGFRSTKATGAGGSSPTPPPNPNPNPAPNQAVATSPPPPMSIPIEYFGPTSNTLNKPPTSPKSAHLGQATTPYPRSPTQSQSHGAYSPYQPPWAARGGGPEVGGSASGNTIPLREYYNPALPQHPPRRLWYPFRLESRKPWYRTKIAWSLVALTLVPLAVIMTFLIAGRVRKR